VGSPLRNTIITYRLLNVGELEDCTIYCARFPESVRSEKMMIERLVRAIWKFNGVFLCTKETVDSYNKANDTELTELDYKRMKLRNMEGVVRDRLDAIYLNLQLKQVRMLQGKVMCHVSGEVFPVNNTPEGSIKVRYSIGEIISGTVWGKLTDSEKADVEFLMQGLMPVKEVPVAEEKQQKITHITPPVETVVSNVCPYCGTMRDTYDQILFHIEHECEKVNQTPSTSDQEESSFAKPEHD
jgi:hypothetical protein